MLGRVSTNILKPSIQGTPSNPLSASLLLHRRAVRLGESARAFSASPVALGGRGGNEKGDFRLVYLLKVYSDLIKHVLQYAGFQLNIALRL